MSAVAALFAITSLIAGDEPLRCTDLDMRQVNVFTGRVERQTIRREQPVWWTPFGDIHYEIVATVRPIRVLRGAQVRRPVTVRIECTASKTDFVGRRGCVNFFTTGQIDTFQVDRRTYLGNRNPDRDEVADYDRAMAHPLPLCER
nr:hypothetical protein [uncultured Brevundimonas sp.]